MLFQKGYAPDISLTGDDTNEVLVKYNDENTKQYSEMASVATWFEGNVAPLNPVVGLKWKDTSTNPPALKRFTGLEWELDSFDSSFTPIGDISAETIHEAIEELDGDKASKAELQDYSFPLGVEDIKTKGPVADVRAFGAVGDGVTDDSAAFQAAIDACKIVIIPKTANGYLLASPITINGATELRGEGMAKIIATGSSAINIRGGFTSYTDAYNVIRNLWFDMTGASAGSSALLFKTTSENVGLFRAYNLIFSNCYSAAKQESNTHYVYDLTFNGVFSYLQKGTQFEFNKSQGFMRFIDIQIDQTLNTSGHITWSAAAFSNVAGLELTMFNVYGGIQSTPVSQSQFAVSIINTSGVAAVYIDRILIDSTEGSGVLISGCDGVYFKELQAYGNYGGGIYLLNCSNIQGSGMLGTGQHISGQAGITFDGCLKGQITNVRSEFNDIGVSLGNGTTNMLISNIWSINNMNYGWLESNGTGTTNYNVKIGAQFTGNTVGNFVQVGSSSAFTNYVINSGAYVASTVGAATV